MDDETKEKVAKLPAWARELIRRLEIRAEPKDMELREMSFRISKAENVAKMYRERNETLTELLNCAAKGGHETAKEAVKTIMEELKPIEEEE